MAVNGQLHETVALTSGNLQPVPADKNIRNKLEGTMPLVRPWCEGETHT